MLCSKEQFTAEYVSHIIHPSDRALHCEAYVSSLWFRYQFVSFLRPTRIVELGVRCGYSAWAMMKAAPSAKFWGYDTFRDEDVGYDVFEDEDTYSYQSKIASGSGAEFLEHAKKILQDYNAEIVVADTQSEGFFPPAADLYHVDAQHGFDQELHDLLVCERVGTLESVILVHDFWVPSVVDAVLKAARERNLSVYEIPAKTDGEAVLTHGEKLEWLEEKFGARRII